jgi:hypothetical protein
MEENISAKRSNEDEVSLKEVILKLGKLTRYLLSKWVLIIGISAIGGAIGCAYAFFDKPIYTAELNFAVEDAKSSSGLSAYAGLASQFGMDLGGNGGNAFSGDNLLELMKSRRVVELALLSKVSINGKTETLAEYYITFNKFGTAWKGTNLENIHFLPDADRSKFTLKQDSVLGVFYRTLVAKNVDVDKLDKKLSIISLKVNSTNELFAMYFTEVLAKVVSDFYIQTKTQKSIKNVTILQRQTDSVRHVLNDAILGVATSTDASPNANPSRLALHVPSQRKQVDVQANTAILSELVKNLEVAKMSLLQETPLIQVIDKPILPLEKDKLGKLKGLITGGVVAGFLIVIFLLLKKLFKSL